MLYGTTEETIFLPIEYLKVKETFYLFIVIKWQIYYWEKEITTVYKDLGFSLESMKY